MNALGTASLDRFAEMVRSLNGEPATPMPALPGTVHRLVDAERDIGLPAYLARERDGRACLDLAEEPRAWAA